MQNAGVGKQTLKLWSAVCLIYIYIYIFLYILNS